MKKLFPLLLVFFLSACGDFQINIRIDNPLPPSTTPTAAPASALPAAPSATASPPATVTPQPSTPTVAAAPTSAPMLVTPTVAWPDLPTLPALAAGQPISLTHLAMMDETSGWAVEAGGRLVHTGDGGVTWQDITPPQGQYHAGGFFALDDVVAWATPDQDCGPTDCAGQLTSAIVWRTIDGGRTWQAGQPFSLADADGFTAIIAYNDPVALQFLDAHNGWLLVTVNDQMFQSHYRLYRTADGGVAWERLLDRSNGPLFCSLFGLGFVDQQNGWLGSNCVGLGVQDELWDVYQTQDGGRAWSEARLLPPADLPAGFDQYPSECGASQAAIIPPGAVGLQMDCALYDKSSGYTPYHFYYLTADGGQTWRAWRMTGAVDFLNLDLGWRLTANATGGYDLEHSRDRGLTWAAIKTVAWDGQLDFVDERTGWAIA